jgi:hypothetical protein
MEIPYRLQEWLAERVRWVQYPRMRRVERQPERRWTWPMPLGIRIGLTALFVWLIVVLGTVLCATLYVFFLAIT